MNANTEYRIFIATVFLFATVSNIFSFFGKIWKEFLSLPVISLFALWMFSGMIIADKFLANLPEPNYSATTVWIFIAILAILFIFSTIALAKKKWRDWDPRNWK